MHSEKPGAAASNSLIPPLSAMHPTQSKTRVLLVAESVTLAHVGRLLGLARGLDPRQFEVTFATGERYRHFAQLEGHLVEPMTSAITPELFAKAIDTGAPLFTLPRLRQCVKQDLALFDRTNPDVVVGDFRPSLALSARIAGVPFVSITNAYWSPWSTQRFPVPDLPLVRLLGPTVAGVLMRPFLPAILNQYSYAFEKLAREFGLQAFGSLRAAYSSADLTCYADLPSFAPTTSLPQSHCYIGPVQWELRIPLPTWWEELPRDRPLIYLPVGSSGSPKVLEVAATALGDLDVTVVSATAGRASGSLPPNFKVAQYLPGSAVAARAALVISNGGALSTYQALQHGVPVLAVPSNADQFFSSERMIAQGVGSMLRLSSLDPEVLQLKVKAMLSDEALAERAPEFVTIDSRDLGFGCGSRSRHSMIKRAVAICGGAFVLRISPSQNERPLTCNRLQ